MVPPDTIVEAPKGVTPFSAKYGLWIFAFIRGNTTEAVEPEAMDFRRFNFYDISHMYDGSGWYCEADGEISIVHRGDAIIVPPQLRHKYAGYKTFYTEDSVSFCGPVADSLFQSGVMHAGIVKFGSVRRLLPIIELMLNCTRESQLRANIALQNLLVDLYFESKVNDDATTVPNFIDQLLNEIKYHPDRWWSVESMAELCNLSTTHFNRVFKQRTGMTPKNYIDNVKMQMAVEMLSSRDLGINAVAAKLGFADPYHFSRRFRQIKGHSPQHYREMFAR